MYTRTNQSLSFARKYNTPLFGYGNTNDDDLVKERGWDVGTELRREVNKSTKCIVAMIQEMISYIVFDDHAPFVSEFTEGLQNVHRNQRQVFWSVFSVYFASEGKKMKQCLL